MLKVPVRLPPQIACKRARVIQGRLWYSVTNSRVYIAGQTTAKGVEIANATDQQSSVSQSASVTALRSSIYILGLRNVPSWLDGNRRSIVEAVACLVAALTAGHPERFTNP